MVNAKSLTNVDSEVFSLHSVDVNNTVSQEIRTMCPYRHVRVSRAMEEAPVSIVLATKVILVFSLMASLVSISLEYRIHIYLLITV